MSTRKVLCRLPGWCIADFDESSARFHGGHIHSTVLVAMTYVLRRDGAGGVPVASPQRACVTIDEIGVHLSAPPDNN